MLTWLHFPITPYQPISERYLYMGNIGLSLVVANLILALPLFLITPTAVAVLTYYLTRLLLHLNAYKNDTMFLLYNTYDINFRKSFGAWLIKGTKEYDQQKLFQALESWAHGLAHKPDDSRLHFLIANTLSRMGFYKEALFHLDECEKYPVDVKQGVHKIAPQLRKQYQEGLRKKEEMLKKVKQ